MKKTKACKITKKKYKKKYTKKHIHHYNHNKNQNHNKNHTHINQKGGTEITEDDINTFLQLISEQKIYTSNFDKLCRENSILLKFFKKPSDCDILFLNLLSKRQIVDQIIKVTTTQDTFNKVTIDEVTNFIENNSCTIKSNPSSTKLKDIKKTVKTIVANVFNKGFSVEAITPILEITSTDEYDSDKKEFKSGLLNLLTENEQSYNLKINDMLEIYFGISDKNDPELCELVNVIFNLSRLNGLLSTNDMSDIVKQISKGAVLPRQNLKLDKLSDHSMDLLISKTNKLLTEKLDQFCLKYPPEKLPSSLSLNHTQVGGGYIRSIWSGFKQLFVRPLAAALYIPLAAFHAVVSIGTAVLSGIIYWGSIRSVNLWKNVYTPYFFDTFYKKIVRTLGEIAFDTWDETIINKHMETLYLIFHKYKVQINDDIIKEYKILIPFLVKYFPLYQNEKTIEIPENIQDMLKEKCLIDDYDQQLDYLYYRKRNYISLLIKYLLDKLGQIDEYDLKNILMDGFYFKGGHYYIDNFIDYNLKPPDYFALDCRNLKYVRKVKSGYHSRYNNYKKRVFTKDKADLITFTVNPYIEQSSSNQINKVNPLFQDSINIDEEFKNSNQPEYYQVDEARKPPFINYRNKVPPYEYPPQYENSQEVSNYYQEESEIYKLLNTKSNIDNFLIVEPKIISDDNNNITQFIYDYSNIKEGIDMLLDYLSKIDKTVDRQVNREKFKEFIDDQLNESYKQGLVKIIMYGIYNPFKIVFEKCYLWLTGKKQDSRSWSISLEKLFINAWNLNLMSCDDITCLKTKKISINLTTNKENQNHTLEIINNGDPFPFNDNDHEDHPYSDLIFFFAKVYDKDYNHPIDLYKSFMIGNGVIDFESLSQNTNFNLRFRNNESGESVVKLERITPIQ